MKETASQPCVLTASSIYIYMGLGLRMPVYVQPVGFDRLQFFSVCSSLRDFVLDLGLACQPRRSVF